MGRLDALDVGASGSFGSLVPIIIIVAFWGGWVWYSWLVSRVYDFAIEISAKDWDRPAFFVAGGVLYIATIAWLNVVSSIAHTFFQWCVEVVIEWVLEWLIVIVVVGIMAAGAWVVFFGGTLLLAGAAWIIYALRRLLR